MSWRRILSTLTIGVYLIAVAWPCEPTWMAARMAPVPAVESSPSPDPHAAHAVAGHAAHTTTSHVVAPDHGGTHADHSHHSNHRAASATAPESSAPPPDLGTDLAFEPVCPCGCGDRSADSTVTSGSVGSAVLATRWMRSPQPARPGIPPDVTLRLPDVAFPIDPIPI